VALWKLLPWNAVLVELPCMPLAVLPWKLLVLPWNEVLLWPNPEPPSVWPAPMLPVNPWLPLTLRVVAVLDTPADRLPAIDALDPNREPLVDELPKCEPSMFDTARFAEIELRVDEAEDDPVIPPRFDPDMLEDPPKFPACEFDATVGEFEPVLDPRAAPATDELPVFAPACVPAVLPVLPPVLRALFAPPEPLPEPLNECQLPSAFAPVAPRPAGQPDDRAFKLFECPAEFAPLVPLRPAEEAAPPLRAFAEFPAERPPYMPFDRAPPYIEPPP
jgi:hypothetical protein